jgi:hypothetical protein
MSRRIGYFLEGYALDHRTRHSVLSVNGLQPHPRWSTRGNELMLIVTDPEIMQDFGHGLG